MNRAPEYPERYAEVARIIYLRWRQFRDRAMTSFVMAGNRVEFVVSYHLQNIWFVPNNEA